MTFLVRRERTTKIDAPTDRDCRPFALVLTGGRSLIARPDRLC
jgi:hypothetical protein